MPARAPSPARRMPVLRIAGRIVLGVLAAALALQLFFLLRIALMAVVDPQSTTFQRSEFVRLARAEGEFGWSQRWLDYDALSDNLKRAVVASEDDGFFEHNGVEWDAIERAWERNQQAEQRALERHSGRPPRIVGGSTITQQLAKNLLLSGERTLARKGQELVLTFMLEKLLDKRRILEIYLNNVEWGAGVFGAEAAAQHYYRKSASQLTAYEAARLAVMLPNPKRFEKLPNSRYVAGRAQTIAGRMRAVTLP
ncbi:MAG: Biosynthetic peptidoglycan transglycosylase [Paracidovorax wautersii]|uniref:Biosynthetic peptidoglycan transglycosylase n=1 Tax=Paracidovorax wautersii TaxID=1177982 RepID=A0A7V8JSC5_9BURK|nr:MAG: Biosynthetic peptidoglycan transglycosylase [Paracidovorax wautersii]